MNILDCVPTGKNVLLPKDAAIRQLQQIYDSMSEARLCAHSGANYYEPRDGATEVDKLMERI